MASAIRDRSRSASAPRHQGLRLSAAAFTQLEDDGFRYELIDGVVCMSPSRTFRHQRVILAVMFELEAFLRDHRIGECVADIDVHLGPGPQGRDLVYRPDLVFISNERSSIIGEWIYGAPDVVVEVLSPSTRALDQTTKRDDYERAGVREYWLIDPWADRCTFLRREAGGFEEAAVDGDRYRSAAISGFVLEIGQLRERWRGQGGA